MKRNKRILMLVFYFVGMSVSVLSSIFRRSLSDFTLGFFEGMSIVLILLGFIYMVWCLAHRKNPYDLKS